MSDLDRGLARRRIAIEGQDPTAPEGIQHGIDHRAVEPEGIELAPADPSTRVLAALSETDEPQEELAGHVGLAGSQRVERLVRTVRQGSGDPAHRAVCLHRQARTVALLDQLGEGELEERQRTGLVHHVGDEGAHDPRLDPQAHPFGRPPDRELVFVGRERRQGLGGRREERPEPLVGEGPVIEVGPQRRDDVKTAVGVDGRHADRFQEAFADLLVAGEREELLQLVDEQDQPRAGWQHLLDGEQEAPWPGLEGLAERRRGPDRHAGERGLQLAERVGTRVQVADERR